VQRPKLSTGAKNYFVHSLHIRKHIYPILTKSKIKLMYISPVTSE